MDIWEKLAKLRKKYPDEESAEALKDYDVRIKKAMLIGRLQDHDGFKLLIGKYAGEIQTIERELSTNSALFKDTEGQILGRLLHERKRWCQDFIKIFDNAQLGLASMERLLDTKLNE